MKKNLDNLFQEKLTDLQELPNDNVWKSIEASLNKNKKSRRILPLWWTLGGVAALLAILFYVAQPNALDLDTNTIITDQEQKNVTTPNVIEETQNRALESEEEAITNIETPEKIQNKNKGTILGTKEKESSWAATSTKNENPSKKDNSFSNTTTNQVKGSEKESSIASFTPNDSPNSISNTEKVNMVAENKSTPNNNIPTDDGLGNASNKKPQIPTTLDLEATKIADQETTKAKTPNNKKSIYDEINAQENEKLITETNSNKWSLEPSVAPVYFNGFGSGSPIHPEFSSNSKSGNVNLSYGVFVSYEVSKKLSVRSGVHKVDYGYDTNDVNFTSSFAATSNNSLSNIDYASNASNLIVVSTSNTKPSSNIQGEISGKTPSKNGSMIQQFGYLEIPLELNYALLDKDFGISLVGGFSSLFLTNNAVLLEADGLNTEIGEANNINDVNFSSNIGFGLNYKFTPKIKFNIEPVFKYQLNTFSNSAGDFKPFSIGIYSGFNFKF